MAFGKILFGYWQDASAPQTGTSPQGYLSVWLTWQLAMRNLGDSKKETNVFYLFDHIFFIGSESLSSDNNHETPSPLQGELSKNLDIF